MRNWSQFTLGLMVFVSGIVLVPLGGALPGGIIVAAFGVLLLVRWSAASYRWQCGECGSTFRISMIQDFTGVNGGIRTKYLHCPSCGRRRWCRGI